MKTFNLYGDEWDRTEDRAGWRSKDGWVGARLDAELLGGSLYELEAGDRLWPYHLHHANEEWLIVVRGRPTLRSPDGEQDLAEGDVVVFPRGKSGAHQVSNRTSEPVRVLMASVAGTLGGFGQASYSTTKSGILGLTRTLAMEGGRHGITCNAIVPGIIGTEAFHMPCWSKTRPPDEA